MRNVFVEGPDDKYRKAKDLIDDIIRVQKQVTNPQIHTAVADVNPFSSMHNQDNILKFDVPDKMVGLVIGKGGETLKSIALKSNTKIFVPQKNPNPAAEHSKNNNFTRVVEVIGSEMEQQIAKDLIFELIDGYHKNQKSQNKYQPYQSV